MADDLGWGDTAYNGHPVLKTPNLDAMAGNGLRFDRFYAGAPVCSPTRGSVLTGRHPSRYGILTANHGHLKAEETCLAEVLGGLGYATGHFGKWHLGTLTTDFSGKGPRRKPQANFMTPGMAGFDEWFSTEYAVATWDPYSKDNAHGISDPRTLYWHNGRNITNGPAEGLTGCDSRIIMDKALPFVEQAVEQRKPFFAVIWFHAPHAPVVGGPEYRAEYPEAPEQVQHYYAAVSALDAQMGRLRTALRALGVADQTLLWFCSDNGPEGNPEKTGRYQGSAGPFRGRKRSLYEGGVRVPGIIEWPARIPVARRTDFPAVTSDMFPTVLATLGHRLPQERRRPYDGVSLLPLLEGRLEERSQPIGFQFQGMASLTSQRHKLVHNPTRKRPRSDNGTTPVAEWELYDLSQDPSERKNVAAQHPETVDRMREELRAWQRSCESSARAQRRPNLVFLLADDQCTYSMGCYGNSDVRTPQLDRLASEGLTFDNHYDTTAICMASRASVLTGKFEYKTGCNFGHGNLLARHWQQSYPVLLRQAGYQTAFAGKIGIEVADLPDGSGQLPKQDFDRWGAGPGQTFYETRKNLSIAHYADVYPHSTLAYGAFGRDFIRDKPHNFGREHGRHFARQSRQGRQYARFTDWRYDTDYDGVMRRYHQQVYGIDVAVGMIRQALEETGVADNTVILYTSDNGFLCGSHGYGSKVLPYEESSRVPLILYDPRHPTSGRGLRCRALTGNVDIAPTLLALAGLPFPPELDGRSLLPLLDNPEDEIHTSLPLINVWGPAAVHSLGVVTRDYKYVFWPYAQNGFQPTEELYCTRLDPLELTSLVSQREQAPTLNRLRIIYDAAVLGWRKHAVPYHDYTRFGTLFDRHVP
jgi:arylsulfatase A-like enzyme